MGHQIATCLVASGRWETRCVGYHDDEGVTLPMIHIHAGPLEIGSVAGCNLLREMCSFRKRGRGTAELIRHHALAPRFKEHTAVEAQKGNRPRASQRV